MLFLGFRHLVFTPALTFYPLPRGEEMAVAGFGFAAYCRANSAAVNSKDAAHVSPSPWGEGRVEGGHWANQTM